MKLNRLTTYAGLVAGLIGSAMTAGAVGPLYDKVIVDLPYAVSINNTVLEPGHYVIRQLDDPSGGSRILQIFGDNGTKLEATANTIATLDNNTPERTSVTLHHYGNDYFFDKVMVQGKNYGYEFPLPDAVKARQKERAEPYTVAARYEPAPMPVAAPEPAPAPAPAEVAEAPAPAPEPMPQAAPAPQQAPEPAPAPETNTMPSTADGWAFEVAAGLLLVTVGFFVRRRLA